MTHLHLSVSNITCKTSKRIWILKSQICTFACCPKQNFSFLLTQRQKNKKLQNEFSQSSNGCRYIYNRYILFDTIDISIFFSALKTVAFDLSKEAISTHTVVKVAEPKKKVTPIPRQVILSSLFSIYFFVEIPDL